MKEDPNYNEVSMDVDMYVPGFVPNPPSFLQKILLVIKRFWHRIIGKKEKVYKPESLDLRYVHVGDLNEKNLKEMKGGIGLYIVRNRISGSVVVTNGTLDSLKKLYDGRDYEIVEPAIKE